MKKLPTEESTVTPGKGTEAQLTPPLRVLRMAFSITPQPALASNMCSFSRGGPSTAVRGGVGVTVGVSVCVGVAVSVAVGVPDGICVGSGGGVGSRLNSQARLASIRIIRAGMKA